MFIALIAYAVIGLSTLVALASMILKIGKMLGDCPESKSAARSAAVTIATGFCAIGAGGVLLIGAALPIMGNDAAFGVLVALGLAVLCLGLGFTQAITTLRAVLRGADLPKEPVRSEPVVSAQMS